MAPKVMPKHPKYPLEPVLEHRDREVDDATTSLADAIRRREDADARRARSERERREAEERAAAERQLERERLAEGELRAADLARADAWEMGVRREITDLSRAAERAAAESASASAEEDAARSELAQKKADRDVVAKDQARFVEKHRKHAEAVEEEDGAEAWRGRRGSE